MSYTGQFLYGKVRGGMERRIWTFQDHTESQVALAHVYISGSSYQVLGVLVETVVKRIV